MSADTLESVLAAYLIVGPIGAAAGMLIIAWRSLRSGAHEGRIAKRRPASSIDEERPIGSEQHFAHRLDRQPVLLSSGREIDQRP